MSRNYGKEKNFLLVRKQKKSAKFLGKIPQSNSVHEAEGCGFEKLAKFRQKA